MLFRSIVGEIPVPIKFAGEISLLEAVEEVRFSELEFWEIPFSAFLEFRSISVKVTELEPEKFPEVFDVSFICKEGVGEEISILGEIVQKKTDPTTGGFGLVINLLLYL